MEVLDCVGATTVSGAFLVSQPYRPLHRHVNDVFPLPHMQHTPKETKLQEKPLWLAEAAHHYTQSFMGNQNISLMSFLVVTLNAKNHILQIAIILYNLKTFYLIAQQSNLNVFSTDYWTLRTEAYFSPHCIARFAEGFYSHSPHHHHHRHCLHCLCCRQRLYQRTKSCLELLCPAAKATKPHSQKHHLLSGSNLTV